MKCPGCQDKVEKLIPYNGQSLCGECIEDLVEEQNLAQARRGGSRDEDDWK